MIPIIEEYRFQKNTRRFLEIPEDYYYVFYQDKYQDLINNDTEGDIESYQMIKKSFGIS